MSVSRESVIRGVITSCEWCVRRLLRLGNLESRCGFSYGGLSLEVDDVWHAVRVCCLALARPEVWDEAVIGRV